MTAQDPLLAMSELQSRLDRLASENLANTLSDWQVLKADIETTCQDLLRIDPASAHDYLPLLGDMITRLDLLIADRKGQ